MSGLFWCENCNVPILKSICENCHHRGIDICSDIRPVFYEEAKLIEKQTKIKLPGHTWEEGLWERQNTLWWNGKRLMRLNRSISGIKVEDAFLNGVSAGDTTHTNVRILYRANKSSITKMEKEACGFIRSAVRNNPDRLPIVSFSGGKDSTVVSYLVRKALRKEAVPHIFGDTTMEYPDTYLYVEEFMKEHRDVPFYRPRCKNDFLKMCKLLGPPSRINAWCCSVFKASPIAGIANTINETLGIISFEGIRKSESCRRRNRERLYKNKKIVHQLSAYPILEWNEIHVWMMILTRALSFNRAYLEGLTRVGCLYCPNNSSRNEFILQSCYPDKLQQWKSFIYSYAKRIGKKKPIEYYSSGAWKMRVGKTDGKSLLYVRKVPCLKNQNAMHFILDVPINDFFIERFKPFGNLKTFSDNKGEGFVAVDTKTGTNLFMLRRVKNIDILRNESEFDPSWKLGKEFLCVDILNEKNKRKLSDTIERQIRKYQVCVSCGACAGVCPTGAITINPHFRISNKKCNNCGRCLSSRFIKASCVAINSQQQSRRFENVHRI